MSQKATLNDVSVFTLGGTALIATFRGGEVTFTNMDDEGHTATMKANSPQLVKKSVDLKFSLVDNVSGISRVTNLNVSALTIGGTAYVAELESGTMTIGYVSQEVDGVGDMFTYTQNIRLGDVTLSANLYCPAAAVPAIVGLGASATASDAVLDVTLTINGVSFTMPMFISSVGHSVERDGPQMIPVTLKLRDDGDANIPNAPTGTTTMLEKAFNAFKTALTLAFTTKASGGITYAGAFVFSGVTVTFANKAVVGIDFEMANQGAVTATVTP
jgi:hypothetical protein